MTIIDQIMQMKNQGMPDEEILNNLQQQGFSPKEINDAINQAQVKSAVDGSSESNFYNGNGNMQQSTMSDSSNQYSQGYNQAPSASDSSQYQNQDYSPQQSQDEYDNQYQNQDYSPQGYSQSGSVVEIAEQVVQEELKSFSSKLREIQEFKRLTETKIENLSDRLKRIENSMDKMQSAILEKIGSYGNDIQSVKKEMNMLEDSFSKVAKPLLDKSKKHKSSKK